MAITARRWPRRQAAAGAWVLLWCLLESHGASARRTKVRREVLERQEEDFTSRTEASSRTTTLEMSTTRKNCMVQDLLNSQYFPPEEHGDKSVRLAISESPVGDIYLVLDQIQFGSIMAQVKLTRISNDLFTFELGGPAEARNDAGKQIFMASVRGWVEGMDFSLPKGSLEGLGRFVSGLQNFIGTIFTLGFNREFGRIDRMKMELDLYMKGSFKAVQDMVDGSYYWEMVPSTLEQNFRYSFGNGGPDILTAIIKSSIESNGGLGPMFANQVWPMIGKLLPGKVGAAFAEVPLGIGQVGLTLNLHGWCERPDSSGHKCPAEELRFSAEWLTEARTEPESLLRSFEKRTQAQKKEASSKTDSAEALAPVLEPTGLEQLWGNLFHNMLSSYDTGQAVFEGSSASIGAKLHIEAPTKSSPDQPLKVDLLGGADLPMMLISGLLGDDVLEALLQFVPRSSDAAATLLGSAQLDLGKLVVPEVSLSNVQIPIHNAAGDVEYAQIGGTLEYFELSEDDQYEDKGFIFDENTPLQVKVPGLSLAATRAGIQLQNINVTKKEAVEARLDRLFFGEKIMEAVNSKGVPNTRKNAEREADGLISGKFQKPFAQMPPAFDLLRQLPLADASFTIRAASPPRKKKKAEASRSVIDFSFKIEASGTALLDNPFWHGVMQTASPDFGYLHHAAVGYWGEVANETEPDVSAFARLDCGSLRVYKLVNKKGATPYEGQIIDVDLAAPGVGERGGILDHAVLFTSRASRQVVRCLRLEVANTSGMFSFITNPKDKFFCSSGSDMQELVEAISIQLQRFTHAKQLQRRICSRDERASVLTTDCKRRPDDTWFKKMDPYDMATYFPGRPSPEDADVVQSPFQLYKTAMSVAQGMCCCKDRDPHSCAFLKPEELDGYFGLAVWEWNSLACPSGTSDYSNHHVAWPSSCIDRRRVIQERPPKRCCCMKPANSFSLQTRADYFCTLVPAAEFAKESGADALTLVSTDDPFDYGRPVCPKAKGFFQYPRYFTDTPKGCEEG